MLNIKKKSQIIVLLILTIAVGIKTNFFRNLAEVALHKFDDRIINKYGYCSGESIGYLLYLKKKYQIKDNPKIVNYTHTPAVNWAIVNTEIIDKNSKKSREIIGIVPQELNMDPFFTPFELLEMQAGLYGVKKKERKTYEVCNNIAEIVIK